MAMQIHYSFLLGILLLIGFALTISEADIRAPPTHFDTASLNRSSFPDGFIFWVGSGAYQYEGAAKEGGRGPSIWDTFTHKYPEKINDSSNGDITVDQYHRYKEDVGIMKNMGWDAYRFSISWSRLLPNGKLSGGVNKEGIKYYNNLINELLRNGLTPFVTLFHWDLPQTLEDEYGGFFKPSIVNHFQDYVELCYKEFGDRVKHWSTLNEPYTFSNNGYALGSLAPGRCSTWQQLNCTGGDSSIEPYLVTTTQLLAHAAAAIKYVYKNRYQASQMEFAEPLTSGDYPQSMRSLVGGRLPKFTKEQSKLLIGSFDFLGLNYYTGYYASDAPQNNSVYASFATDYEGASEWLNVYPRGIQDLLLYTRKKYHSPIIYITENGVDELNDPTLSLAEALNDTHRIDYYNRHLHYVQSSIDNGVKVKGFFPWTLLDDFEWNSGFSVRFGITYVDYNDRLKRHPKLSAHWFKSFLKKY
ncbi:beta-glucosidase 12 isoform X2 [Prunus yedoensis var. nudiflora]|uniref:Beta-glucosidase 12 isoform X2 n=1 Tax=Prunus yedoensis var. nudiflora TaxID=2094558 RepID=A0A314UTK5_PRUYE|nr:beta-glucosidase 12 isoform X2 [Prunus yedoensis var. nudiflora]